MHKVDYKNENHFVIFIDHKPEALKRRKEDNQDKLIRGLKLNKLTWLDHKIEAKISWNPVHPKGQRKTT